MIPNPTNLCLEIRRRRARGQTVEEIAEALGCSVSWVAALSGGKYRFKLRDKPNDRICYPALRRVVYERYGNTLAAFSRACGLSYASVSRALYGLSTPSQTTIDRILRESGLTYEEAFKR